MEVSIDRCKETTQKKSLQLRRTLWLSDRVLKGLRTEEIAQVVASSALVFLFNRMNGPEAVGRMASGNPKHQLLPKETVTMKDQCLDLVFVIPQNMMEYLK